MATDNYVQERIEQAAKERFFSPEAEENIVRRMLKKPDEAQEAIESLSGKDFGDVHFTRHRPRQHPARPRGTVGTVLAVP